MYNYLWVVYQSEEPVLESGAADIGAVVATIDAVTLKWDELKLETVPAAALAWEAGRLRLFLHEARLPLPRVRAPAPIPRTGE